MLWEIMVILGLILISGGFFLHRKEKTRQGYMRIHTREEIRESRRDIEKDEEDGKGGHVNLFSNIFGGSSEEKMERKGRKLQERKEKKKKWQSMGLFGG